ncbi:MAG: dihydrofolate reductase [Patescibacteria group bacterium]|nr:dihydrofolate reductase [Patescibacteria group bacterium]
MDGRISLSEKAPPDWTSEEDWKFFQEELEKCDAFVIGRNTFEGLKGRARPNTFVFSRYPSATPQEKDVTFINPGIADLKQLLSPFRRIGIVGGARVYQSMLDQGLLNEIYVTIEPILFGRGREMFEGGTKDHGLKLLSVQTLNKKGTVLLHYEVLR